MGHGGAPLLAAFLLAGCAAPSAPPPSQGPVPEADSLSGIPPGVLASRAVFDLESGDPARMARARCVLRSLDPGHLEAWEMRAAAAPEGSAPRLLLLAVRSDRGDSLADLPPGEVVAMVLREVASDLPGRRGTLLGLERLRALGPAAEAPLLREARGGPAAGTARALLRVLALGERDLPDAGP